MKRFNTILKINIIWHYLKKKITSIFTLMYQKMPLSKSEKDKRLWLLHKKNKLEHKEHRLMHKEHRLMH